MLCKTCNRVHLPHQIGTEYCIQILTDEIRKWKRKYLDMYSMSDKDNYENNLKVFKLEEEKFILEARIKQLEDENIRLSKLNSELRGYNSE